MSRSLKRRLFLLEYVNLQTPDSVAHFRFLKRSAIESPAKSGWSYIHIVDQNSQDLFISTRHLFKMGFFLQVYGPIRCVQWASGA